MKPGIVTSGFNNVVRVFLGRMAHCAHSPRGPGSIWSLNTTIEGPTHRQLPVTVWDCNLCGAHVTHCVSALFALLHQQLHISCAGSR
jgi:hypothetical protein